MSFDRQAETPVQTQTLTHEQQQVVDTWGQGLAVLAGAGSGKTTTLVSKCARLLELNPEARFAAVSFTERSAGDLYAKLSERLLQVRGPGAMNPHWVKTIHGLCGSVIREFPREAGFDGEETVLTEMDSQLYWEQAIEGLWLDTIPDEIGEAFEMLLDRESRDQLAALLNRVRDLNIFGVRESLRESTGPEANALEKVAGYVLERYDRAKRRRGALDFQDLEKGADQALSHPHVRAYYQKRFDLVLVDEFQDTNPVQARLIWKFVRPDLSNLCVVGDPKQSIYRFRDADVTVFEELCSRFPVRCSLTWNFRSLPGIIETTNRICEKVFAASDLPYESLVPKREAPPGAETVIRLDLESPQELGKWILHQVRDGIPLHEMAILVRKIRGNEKWFRALAAAQIPIAIGSGGLFWEEPRVREMVAFLRWWDHPGHAYSGAVFMRAPWVGIPDEVLDQWVTQDPSLRIPFFASNHPLAVALRPYVHQIVRPGELLMTLLINQFVEDELGAPLLGLWHRVEELSARGLDFHGVVREISLALERKRREREVPAPRQLGQLPVLTLHGAKGLEFQHVILIDLSGPVRASDTPLLFWDRQKGAYFATRDSNGDRQRKHPVEDVWKELEKKKNLAESKRLFYVALTRARDRLVLVCTQQLEKAPPKTQSAGNTQSDQDAAKAAFSRDDWRGWLDHSKVPIATESVSDLPPWTPEIGSKAEGDSKPVGKSSQCFPTGKSSQCFPTGKSSQCFPTGKSSQWTRARHSVTEWNLLARCPRAYEWTFIRPRVKSSSSAIETEPVISNQELGTRVHSYLESGNYDGLKELEAEVGSQRFLAEPVIRWAQNARYMAPADPEVGREVWTELNFEVPLQEEVLVGTIDRIVMEKSPLGQAVYSMIDFKISEKAKPVGSMVEAYRNQMQLYAWALTALDPLIQPEQIKMLLVNISADSIQTIPLKVGQISGEQSLSFLLKQESVRIISGDAGTPKTGPLCRICDFRSNCPEGENWMARSSNSI